MPTHLVVCFFRTIKFFTVIELDRANFGFLKQFQKIEYIFIPRYSEQKQSRNLSAIQCIQHMKLQRLVLLYYRLLLSNSQPKTELLVCLIIKKYAILLVYFQNSLFRRKMLVTRADLIRLLRGPNLAIHLIGDLPKLGLLNAEN